jgi:hypothetical protein
MTVQIFARYFIISEIIFVYINIFGKLFGLIENIVEKYFQTKLSWKYIYEYGI